jgi:Fe-S-cluster containining protein
MPMPAENRQSEKGRMEAYDCQTCGACCVHLGPYDGNAYVYLDRDEASRMRRLGLRVIAAPLGSRCLAAAPHEGAWGYPACVAFEGAVGERCACTIHPERPSICRDFEVGSDLCREARERAGLPT